MAHFTTSNTEGYTAEELAVINAAFETLEDEGIDNDMGRVDDAINNAWFEGASSAEIVDAVKARLAA